MAEVALSVDEHGVGIIEMDRAPAKNALNRSMMSQLDAILHDIHQRKPEVKALIIRSKYAEFFSAGGDIKEWYAYDTIEAYQEGYRGGKIFAALEELPVVTIAAISGTCLGGGCELALSCDIRICTPDATFGQPEILLGNGPSWGGYYRLARTVGIAAAKEMILLGDTYTAAEAHRLGLVNRVVPTYEELLKTAYVTARKAALNADTAAVSKLVLNRIQQDTVSTNFLIDAHSAAYFAGTETSKTRKQAFMEKRLKELLEIR
jgi:enoyl-CoA hydratase